ncbi:MAG: VOC family protein [Pseudomonadota bacterium]
MTAAATDRAVTRFQHHVFYVSDLERSKAFYSALLDLQLSALNHPDSSAAMRLARQQMQFYSFGYYHHDICLVQMLDHQPDNGSMLYFAVKTSPSHFDMIAANAAALEATRRDGRLLASARLKDGERALSVRDPDGHWLEIISEAA